MQKRTQPNQGIQRSALNGALLGVSIITLFTSVGIWIFGKDSLVCLPLLFIIPFLEFGGSSYIEHYALRYALTCQNDIPFYYVRFLNNMAEQRILQRVGGGYRFLHNLFLEHFADEKWKASN